MHEKHALAMCNAGCFGPLTRLAHKAVVEAYVAAEPAIDISASFDAFVMSGGTSKTLVMATDLVYSDQFARDAMMYLNMSMKYVDCARAVLDDLELDAAHEKYPEVMRALRDVSTSDDIFDKSECAGMMCVAWILRWRLKFGDEIANKRRALRSRLGRGPRARRGESNRVRLFESFQWNTRPGRDEDECLFVATRGRKSNTFLNHKNNSATRRRRPAPRALRPTLRSSPARHPAPPF